MTIYVDNVFIPARVGRIDSRWCHLFSDDYFSDDLHALARTIGLRRQWFQYKAKASGSPAAPPWMWHYDVTEAARRRAVTAGAVECDYTKLAEIVGRKHAQFAQLSDMDQEKQKLRWADIATGRTPAEETLF